MKIEVIDILEGLSNATLTAYIQDIPTECEIQASRPAVIICPGGGYIGITEKEAEPVALRFVSSGYQAFVLRYSIGADMSRFPAPFIDAAKTVMIVRENARGWGIDPDNISICGFSVGGHVAATLAATWQEDYLSKALNAENELFKPNALILGYPLLDLYRFKVRNLSSSPDMQTLLEMIFTAAYGMVNPSKALTEQWNCISNITSSMPPTFLWMIAEDALVDVEEGLDFIKALSLNKVSYEFHVFQKGSHGMSLGDQTVGYSDKNISEKGNANRWVDLALNWLKTSKQQL